MGFVALSRYKVGKDTGSMLRTHALSLRLLLNARVLSLPKIERNRRTGAGAVDAMAEAFALGEGIPFSS